MLTSKRIHETFESILNNLEGENPNIPLERERARACNGAMTMMKLDLADENRLGNNKVPMPWANILSDKT